MKKKNQPHTYTHHTCWLPVSITKASSQTSRNYISTVLKTPPCKHCFNNQHSASRKSNAPGRRDGVFLGCWAASSRGKQLEGGRCRGERHWMPQEGSNMHLPKQSPFSWTSCPSSRQIYEHSAIKNRGPRPHTELKPWWKLQYHTGDSFPRMRRCSAIINKGAENI